MVRPQYLPFDSAESAGCACLSGLQLQTAAPKRHYLAMLGANNVRVLSCVDVV